MKGLFCTLPLHNKEARQPKQTHVSICCYIVELSPIFSIELANAQTFTFVVGRWKKNLIPCDVFLSVMRLGKKNPARCVEPFLSCCHGNCV